MTDSIHNLPDEDKFELSVEEQLEMNRKQVDKDICLGFFFVAVVIIFLCLDSIYYAS